MAPKPTWPEKIKAPAEAIKLYRQMAKLQMTKDFQKCHIYEGASTNGVPVVSWDNKVTALPKIICSFMGLPFKKKTCNTPGCMNPFHYVDQVDPTRGKLPQALAPVPVILPSLADYIELVVYHIEENCPNPNPTFEQLRSIIPAEDITDELLQKVLNEINRKL